MVLPRKTNRYLTDGFYAAGLSVTTGRCLRPSWYETINSKGVLRGSYSDMLRLISELVTDNGPLITNSYTRWDVCRQVLDTGAWRYNIFLAVKMEAVS